jgi:hypothetical protein
MSIPRRLTPREQMRLQAEYTMKMIRVLLPYAADDSATRPSDADVGNACLESFLMHVRAITDFLCCRRGFEPDMRDFSARDLVPDWQPTPPEAAARLEEEWEKASQHVAHFSRSRLQDLDAPVYYDRSVAGLTEVEAAAVAVWQAFSATLGD